MITPKLCIKIYIQKTWARHFNTFKLFKKIVDEADEIGVGAITIASRGEPTLHKQFPEMMNHLGNKKNIFEIKVNTNGTFLSEKICHSIFKNGL